MFPCMLNNDMKSSNHVRITLIYQSRYFKNMYNSMLLHSSKVSWHISVKIFREKLEILSYIRKLILLYLVVSRIT